jgi:hypothetical protein
LGLAGGAHDDSADAVNAVSTSQTSARAVVIALQR